MSIGKLLTNALDFQNVVADGTATLKYVPKRALHRMILVLGGTAFTKAMMTLIKIKVNGSTKFEISGSDMDAINKYRGMTANAAFLTIDFTEIFGRDYVDQVVGAWDTSMGFNTVTIEVTIAGATAPTLRAILDESAPQSLNPKEAAFAGMMTKILRYPWSRSAGGKLPVDLPFGGNGAVIKRLHVTHTGNVTDVEAKEDKVTIFEGLAADLSFIQTEYNRVPQANILTMDFVVDGNLKNAWDTRDASSIELNLNLSAADSGYVYAEYLDELGNL